MTTKQRAFLVGVALLVAAFVGAVAAFWAHATVGLSSEARAAAAFTCGVPALAGLILALVGTPT